MKEVVMFAVALLVLAATPTLAQQQTRYCSPNGSSLGTSVPYGKVAGASTTRAATRSAPAPRSAVPLRSMTRVATSLVVPAANCIIRGRRNAWGRSKARAALTER
jgi:hypothetical protein